MVSLSLRLTAAALAVWALGGCSLGYLARNAYHQARLLKRAEPISDVLNDPSVSDSTKHKLRLATEAKAFAETTLKLKPTKNYSTFVQLDGPYVTYIVSAAPKDELKYYTWYFPIVGHVPYKGYFVKQGALDEAEGLKEDGYDVYVRGVSAFSTLGWFKDPVLSSMITFADYDLVNTIIHETVHATLYISSNANFNERLATYLGDLGTILFYQQKQKDHPLLTEIRNDSEDQKIFGEFISREIRELEEWYRAHRQDKDLLEAREKRFQKIRDAFTRDVLPRLKSKKYAKFAEADLNNARLMGLKLYMNDLSDFEKLTKIHNGDFEKILSYLKSLEKEKNPEKALKDFVQAH